MQRKRTICSTSLAMFLSAATASAQIFSDDMSSGANWTVAQDADTTFEFGYDYSQDGLPAAPNGSDTVGLKLTVNNNAPAEIDQIGVFNQNSAYTGQYTFRVDIWSNWALDGGGVGTGTTEFVGVSVGHDASAPGPFGASLIYTGDGDAAATDYRLYKDDFQLQSESGQYALGTMAGARDASNPILQEAFPSFLVQDAVPTQGQTGTQPAGAGGFQWMTVNVEVDTEAIGPSGETSEPGFARFSMRSNRSGNVVEIGTVDNSLEAETPTFMDNIIGLLMSDIFSSVTLNPAFSFGIFDNVLVLDGLVPLETSTGLVGDYNDDGTVNAADYVAWRNNDGTSNELPNDPIGGEIGSDQYQVWVEHFGQFLGAGAGSVTTSIPEPSAINLLAIGILGWCPRRRAGDA